MLIRSLRIVVFQINNIHTKFILTKDDVVTLVALLCALRSEVKDIKDPEISRDIFNYMYANFDADDLELFESVPNIWDNIKYLELEN